MNTNPDGNLVAATLISSLQFENANPNGGQGRLASTYFRNSANRTFNYQSIDYDHNGSRIRINNLQIQFNGNGATTWSTPDNNPNGIAPINQLLNEALRVRDNAFLNWQGQPVNNTAPLFNIYPAGFTATPN